MSTAAIVVALSACAAPVTVAAPEQVEASAEHAEAAAVLAAFRDASNAHDVAAVAQLVAADVVWYRGAAPVLEGREAVLAPIAYDAATNATIRLEELTFEGDEVRCRLVESNDFFRALGIDGLEQRAVFEVDRGRITSIRSLPSGEPSADERTVGRFVAWLARAHPQDAKLLFGAAAPQPAHADRIIARAREWTETGR